MLLVEFETEMLEIEDWGERDEDLDEADDDFFWLRKASVVAIAVGMLSEGGGKYNYE